MIRNLGQVAAIYIGSSAPRNTNLIWLDNTVVPFVFRAYDGSAWSEIATHKWVRAYVDGWLVTLPPRQLADDGDYMLINSNNVNYKITVKDFVKSAVGNPLDFKGVIRVSADFPNPSTLEAGDMYVIITSPVGGTVTDPYSGKTFEDSEKIVWDEVTRSWESLGKINITVNLTTSYSETEVTIHSSAGKETTIQGVTDQLAGVMLPGQYSWLQALSNGSIVPGDPSSLTPLTPAHKHNYNDIINRLVSQQGTGESTIDPMSQKATTDALNLKFDKASVLQVSGAATDKVMSQKAVTDALKTLSDDFNNKLTNYLPLVGGTMKGSIRFPAESGIIGNADGTGDTYILRSFNNRLDIGSAALSTRIISNASDLLHHRSDTSYKIWDAYNLPTPASTTDLANYLPLSGGTMTGSINLGNTPLLASISQGIATLLSINNTNNIETLSFGNTALDLNIYSSNKDLIHYRHTTPYKIWDSYNLSKPTVYNGGAIGTPTTIYDRNLSVNGTGWIFLSATNAPTTSIFAPTTVGTKGYYLVSSGTGAPVWQQLEDLGDGKYLPLIGGTLTGQLTIKQSVDIKLRLQSTDADNHCIIQAINSQASQLGVFGYAGDKWAIGHGGTYYEIWDKFNLKDPVTLSGNNTFTGNNTFQAGKFNVGPFEVTSSGSLLSNISSPAGSAWNRSLVFRANTDIPSSLVFGGYNSVDNTSIGYAYIGIGDVTYSTAQYKFYANSLKVPYKWSIDGPDGSAILWSQTSEIVNLGRAAGTTKIRSGNTDLIHTKGSTEYIIWDKSNLPNPVRYALDASNYPTLLDSNGSSFSYIKAGTNGLLPHSKVALASGGSGLLGTSDQSFNAAYINNLHTNKVTFGDAGSFINNQSGDSSHKGIGFYTPQNAACPVYVGSLCVSDGYANSAPNIPTNGIYSKGVIKSAAGFTSNFRQTNLNLAKTGNDVLYISSFTVDAAGSPGTDSNTGKNVNDGMFLTYFWVNDNAFQLAADIDGTGIAYRQYIPSSGNSTTGWKFLADTNWVVSKINSSTSNYLPLTGGTLTGTLSINSGGSEPLIINNSASAGEAYVVTKTQGTTRGVMGWNSSLGMFLQDSRGYTFSMKADGVYFGANINSLRKLATVTDLNNYLPLTGGALSGVLTINTVGSVPFIANNNAINGTDVFAYFRVKGANKTSVGYSNGNGPFIQDATNDRCIMVKSDGAYFGTELGAGTRLALITDIPNITGYATQTWVNSQNFVKSTSTKKVTDIQPVDALPATQASGVLYLVFG